MRSRTATSVSMAASLSATAVTTLTRSAAHGSGNLLVGLGPGSADALDRALDHGREVGDLAAHSAGTLRRFGQQAFAAKALGRVVGTRHER